MWCGAIILSVVASFGALGSAPRNTTRYFAAYRRAKPYPDGEKLAALSALALPVDGIPRIRCIEITIHQCARLVSGFKCSEMLQVSAIDWAEKWAGASVYGAVSSELNTEG